MPEGGAGSVAKRLLGAGPVRARPAPGHDFELCPKQYCYTCPAVAKAKNKDVYQFCQKKQKTTK